VSSPRACLVVLDAVGAGALPDAADYGEADANTLGHVARAVGGLRLPNLQALGLGRILPLEGCPPRAGPAVVGRLRERSVGMDSTTGHWELMGIISATPRPLYPNGFPASLLSRFSELTGRGVLGNRPASGIAIIDELAEEHRRTGAWIVYTAADSICQIAAHEETVSPAELYEACRIARALLVGEHAVDRVVARPFAGRPGSYRRTPRRRDFSVPPPRPNYLTVLEERDVPVHAVGKVADVFGGLGFASSQRTGSNREGIERTIELLRREREGFVFTNLVETDEVWGHRNDPANFHRSLQEFDASLPALVATLEPGDLLVIASDHGCDPTTPSPFHTREHGLLVAHVAGRRIGGRHDGEFADVGATIGAWLAPDAATGHLPGTPFLRRLSAVGAR
jgi:phosphopentomutase